MRGQQPTERTLTHGVRPLGAERAAAQVGGGGDFLVGVTTNACMARAAVRTGVGEAWEEGATPLTRRAAQTGLGCEPAAAAPGDALHVPPSWVAGEATMHDEQQTGGATAKGRPAQRGPMGRCSPTCTCMRELSNSACTRLGCLAASRTVQGPGRCQSCAGSCPRRPAGCAKEAPPASHGRVQDAPAGRRWRPGPAARARRQPSLNELGRRHRCGACCSPQSC